MKKNIVQHELSPKMEKKIKDTFIKYATISVVTFLLLATILYGYSKWNNQRKLKAYNKYVQEQKVLFEQKAKQTREDVLEEFEQESDQMEKDALERFDEMDKQFQIEKEKAELEIKSLMNN